MAGRFSSLALYYSLLFSASSTFPSTFAHPINRSGRNSLGAVYFLSNSRSANTLISSHINPDGTLSPGSVFATGGKGAVGTVDPPDEAHPDPTFSQHPVVVDQEGGMVFAVNPGTGDFSAFEIPKRDPTQLRFLGTASTGGDGFPVSIAATAMPSTDNSTAAAAATSQDKKKKRHNSPAAAPASRMACALNSAGAGSVSCFEVSSQTGIKALPAATVVSLGLNQQAIPTGPLATVSDIAFDEKNNLVVAVKSAGPNMTGGGLSYFPIAGDAQGQIALGQPNMVAAPAEGGASFAINNPKDGSGRLFVTDAIVGNTIFGGDGRTAAIKVEGNNASCWNTHSKATGSFFSTDIGTGMVTETQVADDMTGSVVAQYPLGGDAATTDLEVASTKRGDFLYVLMAGKTSVAAMSVGQQAGQAKMVQAVDFAKEMPQLGLDTAVMGMATFVK